MMSIRSKLSVMMFLQFFIWGAWLPSSFGYFGGGGLEFTEWEQFGLNIMFPLSAILAMFFSNQFADRNFAAEKFLAASHLIGGVTMLAFGLMAWNHFQAEVPSKPSYWPYFICMAIHCLVYVPTISVTNTIAFANIQDAQNDFGRVRLWGTIGWIAASWPFIFILADWAKINAAQSSGFVEWLGNALGTSLEGQALNQGKSWAFITSGIASLALAGFSLMLPHTPPKPAKLGEGSLAFLDAVKLLKYPFLLVLFIVTFIDATVHDGYFFYAFAYLGKVGVPSQWIQPAMSVGQLAEIGTMAFLGLVLKRFGWRYTMILGILGHTVRFAVFALVPNPIVAVAANVLHGVCYAFFFATLYILVDEVFPKDARTSAQGLFNFLILGMGPIVARYLWPFIQNMYTTKTLVDGVEVVDIKYSSILLYPSGAALIAAVLLLLFFHPPKTEAQMKGPVTAAH
ncbi:nucleoside:H symporter [Pirellula staleyi DSM 6068]|uniref:Nucleoside:H symporter n=1 Tax=Pirellula staleyi (strain ATCC 27377 / DSM 6068 / ICPB 4128) TaxID=530564 RepID=D2QYV2_PIRSD|nr:MFS transporter [Pirellula staleyi]ADB16407.1 nucleoside:H symporter [Pirellula staleyi DSM 6068]